MFHKALNLLPGTLARFESSSACSTAAHNHTSGWLGTEQLQARAAAMPVNGLSCPRGAKYEDGRRAQVKHVGGKLGRRNLKRKYARRNEGIMKELALRQM